jgi:NADH-quinone oxidoreductase subunit C
MTTVISGQQLEADLIHQFPRANVVSSNSAVWVEPNELVAICLYLRENADQKFDLLNSVTAVDYISYFELVYHITSTSRNASIILKTRCEGRLAPEAPSIVSVWKGAELQECEIYDLMGIRFIGHPNLKRIFLWEGFQGYPLRRDYLEPPLPYTWPHGG